MSDYANKVKQGCGENQGIMVKQTVLQLRHIWVQMLPQPVTIMITITVAVPSICSLQHYVLNFSKLLYLYEDIYYLKEQCEKGSMSILTI